jgi:hypothetical protein
MLGLIGLAIAMTIFTIYAVTIGTKRQDENNAMREYRRLHPPEPPAVWMDMGSEHKLTGRSKFGDWKGPPPS